MVVEASIVVLLAECVQRVLTLQLRLLEKLTELLQLGLALTISLDLDAIESVRERMKGENVSLYLTIRGSLGVLETIGQGNELHTQICPLALDLKEML